MKAGDARRLAVLGLHIGYTGVGRAAPQPVQQPVKVGLLSFGHDLDPPIEKVLGVANQIEVAGIPLNPQAVAHALHGSGNKGSQTHGLHGNGSVQERVGRHRAALPAVKDWHPLHLSDDILPELQRRGISQEQIEQMTVNNPARVFG